MAKTICRLYSVFLVLCARKFIDMPKTIDKNVVKIKLRTRSAAQRTLFTDIKFVVVNFGVYFC